MLLSDRGIKFAMTEGRIRIDGISDWQMLPNRGRQIQPASVDLHLGGKYIRYRRKYWLAGPEQEVHYPADPDLSFIQGTKIRLAPGEFILASTKERLTLSRDIAARVEGLSTLGRKGILIHVSAGFVDPGWNNPLTLEVKNVSRFPRTLIVGGRICQVAFMSLDHEVETAYGEGDRNKYASRSSGPVPASDELYDYINEGRV